MFTPGVFLSSCVSKGLPGACKLLSVGQKPGDKSWSLCGLVFLSPLLGHLSFKFCVEKMAGQ